MWLKQISPTSLNQAALPQYVCLKKQVGESLLFICSGALHSTPLGHDVATINALSPSRWSKPHHGMFYWSIKLTPPFHWCHVPYHQALHAAEGHINMWLVKAAVRFNSVHLFLSIIIVQKLWKMYFTLTVYSIITKRCLLDFSFYVLFYAVWCSFGTTAFCRRTKQAAVHLQWCKLHLRSVVPNGGSWWALCVSAYAYLLAPRFLLYFPVEQNGLESFRLPIFSPGFLPVTRKVWESIPIRLLEKNKARKNRPQFVKQSEGAYSSASRRLKMLASTCIQSDYFGSALKTNLCVDLKIIFCFVA